MSELKILNDSELRNVTGGEDYGTKKVISVHPDEDYCDFFHAKSNPETDEKLCKNCIFLLGTKCDNKV